MATGYLGAFPRIQVFFDAIGNHPAKLHLGQLHITLEYHTTIQILLKPLKSILGLIS